jgi:hypothetical protein
MRMVQAALMAVFATTMLGQSSIKGRNAAGRAAESADKRMLFGQFVGDWQFDLLSIQPNGTRVKGNGARRPGRSAARAGKCNRQMFARQVTANSTPRIPRNHSVGKSDVSRDDYSHASNRASIRKGGYETRPGSASTETCPRS